MLVGILIFITKPNISLRTIICIKVTIVTCFIQGNFAFKINLMEHYGILCCNGCSHFFTGDSFSLKDSLKSGQCVLLSVKK